MESESLHLEMQQKMVEFTWEKVSYYPTLWCFVIVQAFHWCPRYIGFSNVQFLAWCKFLVDVDLILLEPFHTYYNNKFSLQMYIHSQFYIVLNTHLSTIHQNTKFMLISNNQIL